MPTHPTRTIFSILILTSVLAFVLAACAVPPLDEPTATPAPTPITTPFAGVREDPQRLTLIQTDLPEGFLVGYGLGGDPTDHINRPDLCLLEG